MQSITRRAITRRVSAFAFLFAAVSGVAVAQRVDMVTAGGWITVAGGAHANFGLNARNPAAPSGEVNYVDHALGMKVHSTSITSYTIVNPTTRQIQGTCTIDGVAGFTFTVVVVDNGQPGRHDTFSITLSNAYTASGTLQGGNVRIHRGP